MKCGFENGKSIFLTYKGTGVHQKMDTVVKLCKKISSTFFLVKEENKIASGFHYHVLIKLKGTKLPPRNWYKKGVHMHILEICPPLFSGGPPPLYTSEKDFEDMRDQIKIESKTELEKLLCLQKLENKIQTLKLKNQNYKLSKKHKKLVACLKVLIYMSKECSEFPIQYTDYYLQIRNKSIRLPTETPVMGE